MSKHRCVHCDIVFDHDPASDSKPRCPKCLRQHNLEAADAPPVRARPRLARRHLVYLLLGLSSLGALVGAGMLFSRHRAVPRPGQLAILDKALLQRTLIWRGVPAETVLDPFASSAELRQLARQAKGEPAARAAEVASRLAPLLAHLAPDLEATSEIGVRAPDVLYAELRAGKARTASSFEVAALLVAALREAGGQAILGETFRVGGPTRTPDLTGGVGRYVAILYAPRQLGRDPLLVLDPLRALPLPAWAGGQDAQMRATPDELTPLDDASAGAHMLALRALRLRRRDSPKAYELSQLALKAASPSPTLHGARAIVLAAAGGFDDAIIEGKKALALRDDASRRCMLGKLLAAANRPGDAVPHLEEALRRDPGYWPAHQVLAALLLPTDPEKGTKHLEAAERIAPGEAPVLMLRALRELGDNKPEAAIPLLRQALARQPSPQSSILLYQALALTGRTEELSRLRAQLLKEAGSSRRQIEQTLQAIDEKLKAAREAQEGGDPTAGAEEAPPPTAPRVPQLKLPDVKLGK